MTPAHGVSVAAAVAEELTCKCWHAGSKKAGQGMYARLCLLRSQHAVVRVCGCAGAYFNVSRGAGRSRTVTLSRQSMP